MTRRRAGLFRWRSKRLVKPQAAPPVIVDVKLVRPDPFNLTPEQWGELENALSSGNNHYSVRTVTREEFAAISPGATPPEPPK